MDDIKMITKLEGVLTFKKLNEDQSIVYKNNNCRIGVYNENIENIKTYCIDNNIEANFIED